MKKKEYNFFLVPNLFSYNYKSLVYNKINKNSLKLQTNVFRNSLSWFSYWLLAKQPVNLSTLKILKKKEFFQNFIKKLILNNFWFSFTVTDMYNCKNYTINSIKTIFDKILIWKFNVELYVIDKSFLWFLFDRNLFFESFDNKVNTFFFDDLSFKNWKQIYTLSTPLDIHTFLIKYFNSINLQNEFPKYNENSFNFDTFKITNFFYETRFFIFFNNINSSEKNFLTFIELIHYLKLKNSIIFLKGMFFFLFEFNWLNYYCNNFWSTCITSNSWNKNIDSNLQSVFLNVFKNTDFCIFKKYFIKNISKNIFSALITKYYYYNKIIIFYFFILLLNKKIIINSNNIFLNFWNKFIFFL